MEVEVIAFIPDYMIGEGNQVLSRSSIPNNPAVLLEGKDEDEVKFRQWFFAQSPKFNFVKNLNYRFELESFWAPELTGLQINKDPGVPLIWAGCGIIMVGFFLSFYLSHRRIRVLIVRERMAGKIMIGGLTNKNQSYFEKEIGQIIEKMKGVLTK